MHVYIRYTCRPLQYVCHFNLYIEFFATAAKGILFYNSANRTNSIYTSTSLNYVSAILIYILKFWLQLCKVLNSTILETYISFYASTHLRLYDVYSLLFFILNFFATAVY